MFQYKALVICAVISSLPFLIRAKPGDEYSTLGGGSDYGVADYGGAYQQPVVETSPVIVKSEVLKPQSTFEIGYGAPPPSGILPYAPFQKFGFGAYGGFAGGWKQPLIAPIQVIAKPIPIPVATVPFGWGWGNAGLFR